MAADQSALCLTLCDPLAFSTDKVPAEKGQTLVRLAGSSLPPLVVSC